jgi:hypothetical protein
MGMETRAITSPKTSQGGSLLLHPLVMSQWNHRSPSLNVLPPTCCVVCTEPHVISIAGPVTTPQFLLPRFL